MLKKRMVEIALIGDHPKLPEWKEEIIQKFRSLQEEYADESLDISFTRTLNPASTPFISVGTFGAQTVDLILCREQLLAARADVTVVVDSSVSNESIKEHLSRIEKKTKAFVIWCPAEDDAVIKPLPKDEIGIRPGSIYLICNKDVLVSCLYFLCISSDASCL